LNDRLKDLRKKMIAQELQHVQFGNINKKKVLNRIRSMDKKKVNHWLPNGLGMLMAAGLMFIAAVFAEDYLKNSYSEKNIDMVQTNKAGIGSETDHLKILTKEDVQLLMINTGEHFRTVKGFFTYENNYLEETVEYQVSLKSNEEGSFVKTKIHGKEQDNQEILSKEDYSKTEILIGDKLLQLYNESKTFQLSTVPRQMNKENNIVGNDNSLQTYAGSAAASLNPFELSVIFLNDHQDWEIEKQSVPYLDRTALVIKGDLNKENRDKFNAFSFSLWVDRQTGILLKKELYGNNQEAVEKLETKELEIDKPLNKKKFSLVIPEDYTLKK